MANYPDQHHGQDTPGFRHERFETLLKSVRKAGMKTVREPLPKRRCGTKACVALRLPVLPSLSVIPSTSRRVALYQYRSESSPAATILGARTALSARCLHLRRLADMAVRAPAVAASPRWAVSPICNRLRVGHSQRFPLRRRLAGCNPAVRQITNLRYAAPTTRGRTIRLQRTTDALD
jgi:hypothetical protein